MSLCVVDLKQCQCQPPEFPCLAIAALVAERDAAERRFVSAVDAVERLTAERDAAVEALRKIKEHVVGDKFPNWSTHDAVYTSRGYIADWCDHYAARHTTAQEPNP